MVVGAPGEDSSTTGVNSSPNESTSDSGAAYVFTRSGTTWSQQAYLKASNTGYGDWFGYSVAVSGDTVVVGAFSENSSTTGVNSTPNKNGYDSGAAYVFTRSGTTWSQQAYLKASNTGEGDQFGTSVAVSLDTVIVGASGEDSNTPGVNSTPNESSRDSGAAYVFTRSGTTWSQQAYLKASNTGEVDYFGNSVAVSGDTVVVGAWGEDSSTIGINSTPNDFSSNTGAAYVFTRSGVSWSQQAYLKASNIGAGFGYSVAVSGATVVVGAKWESSSTTGVNSTPIYNASRSGAAYVFTRSGTTWSQQAYLKASNTGAGDEFGYSVAVSGDTVVVGSLNENSSTTGVNSTPNESASSSGAAYVFTRNGATWSQQAYLKASNTGAGDFFGYSVAVSGDTVVVGAIKEGSSTTGVNSAPNESANSSGAANVFTRSGTTWSQQAYIKASNTPFGSGQSDEFGTSVAVSGDTVVVGAPYEDSITTGVNSTPDETASDSGAAYVFTRSGTTWSQQAYLKASNTGAGDEFGGSVAVSGDTVVIGARGEDSSTTGVNSTPNENASSSGAAYVFIRSGTMWSQQAYLKASNTGQDNFGNSVAVSGETVVVGAPYESSSTTGVNSTPDESASASGAAYVFTHSGTTWSQQAYLKASNTGPSDYFGWSVAVSGDTVVVGAYNEDSSTTGVNSTPNESASNSGAAYVFTRSGTIWSQQAYLKAFNTGTFDYFGWSVAVSGDTVVIGAWSEDSSTTGVNSTPNESASFSGAAYVFTRSVTTWSQQAYLKASNTGASDYFGWSVAVSGDTVVVGAPYEDSGTPGVNSTPNESSRDSGAAYVFTRSGAAWSQQAYLKSSNRVGSDDLLGTSVAVSGGMVVVGARWEDGSTTGVNSTQDFTSFRSGAAYIFSGLGPVVEPSEIAIQLAGTDIATNTTQAFGPLVVGTSSDLVFTILNIGPGALTLTGTPQVAVTGSSDFTVTAQPASPINGPSGSTTFTVRFAPTSIGSKNAVLSIPNNDADENPFTINLSGSGVTAETAFNNTISANSSLTGPNALPTAIPFGDGVENLLKYAFNMNPAGPDVSVLATGGSSGLPLIAVETSGEEPILKVQFLRRKGSGLIYTPQRSDTLGNFQSMTGTQTVTSIDAQWERVTVQEPAPPATAPSAFARVQVSLP